MLLPETLKLHDQTRFEFHYIYFLPWKDQMANEIISAGGRVQCMSASNNFQLILKYRTVFRYIEKNNIQLIHCHLPWAGFLGRIIYRFLGIPVLYTEHNKQERYHKITRLINRLTFNSQSKVIAVSADVSSSISKNISVTIPVCTIQNGVNTDHFRRDIQAGLELRRSLKIPEAAIVIGTIAVFRFQKRLDKWLEVFAVAASKNPNLFGIIVGAGPLKDEIERKIATLGLEGNVLLPGLESNVKPWLSAMDIFMMTSIFEGMPIALLEAMSMECAIATTDAGGIKEVVVNNESGLMVPVEKWEELAIHISHLISHPQLRLELAQNARKRVFDNFGMKKMVQGLEELYGSYKTPSPKGQAAMKEGHL